VPAPREAAAPELRPYLVRTMDSNDILIEGVRELELDRVTTRTPVVRFDRSAGAIVRASRAFPGRGTFPETGIGELKGISLEGNVLGNARQAESGSEGRLLEIRRAREGSRAAK
jgi:hypothetical protein